MKFTYCLSSVVFLMYFSVVVLVIVNGQPTTDDDIDKHEIAQLREELAKAIARIGNLEDQLAAAIDKIDTQKDAGELNILTLQIDGNSKQASKQAQCACLHSVEFVVSFVCLGSLRKSEDNSRPDMKRRISLAALVTSYLGWLWRDRILQLSTSSRPL